MLNLKIFLRERIYSLKIIYVSFPVEFQGGYKLLVWLDCKIAFLLRKQEIDSIKYNRHQLHCDQI